MPFASHLRTKVAKKSRDDVLFATCEIVPNLWESYKRKKKKKPWEKKECGWKQEVSLMEYSLGKTEFYLDPLIQHIVYCSDIQSEIFYKAVMLK